MKPDKYPYISKEIVSEIVDNLRNNVYKFRSNSNIDPIAQANCIEAAFYLGLKKGELIKLTADNVVLDAESNYKATHLVLSNGTKVAIPSCAQGKVYQHYKHAMSKKQRNTIMQPLYPDKHNKFISKKQADRNMGYVQQQSGASKLGHEEIRKAGITNYYNRMENEHGDDPVRKTAKFARVEEERVLEIIHSKPPRKPRNRRTYPNDPSALIMKLYDNIQYGNWDGFSKPEVRIRYQNIRNYILSKRTNPQIYRDREKALASVKDYLVEKGLWSFNC